MQVTVEIPDDFTERFSADRTGLSRRLLELLALEEYKNGHLTDTELRRMLGFGTRYRLDGFLKEHGVLFDDYTVDELRSEVERLERLGF